MTSRGSTLVLGIVSDIRRLLHCEHYAHPFPTSCSHASLPTTPCSCFASEGEFLVLVALLFRKHTSLPQPTQSILPLLKNKGNLLAPIFRNPQKMMSCNADLDPCQSAANPHRWHRATSKPNKRAREADGDFIMLFAGSKDDGGYRKVLKRQDVIAIRFSENVIYHSPYLCTFPTGHGNILVVITPAVNKLRSSLRDDGTRKKNRRAFLGEELGLTVGACNCDACGGGRYLHGALALQLIGVDAETLQRSVVDLLVAGRAGHAQVVHHGRDILRGADLSAEADAVTEPVDASSARTSAAADWERHGREGFLSGMLLWETLLGPECLRILAALRALPRTSTVLLYCDEAEVADTARRVVEAAGLRARAITTLQGIQPARYSLFLPLQIPSDLPELARAAATFMAYSIGGPEVCLPPDHLQRDLVDVLMQSARFGSHLTCRAVELQRDMAFRHLMQHPSHLGKALTAVVGPDRSHRGLYRIQLARVSARAGASRLTRDEQLQCARHLQDAEAVAVAKARAEQLALADAQAAAAERQAAERKAAADRLAAAAAAELQRSHAAAAAAAERAALQAAADQQRAEAAAAKAAAEEQQQLAREAIAARNELRARLIDRGREVLAAVVNGLAAQSTSHAQKLIRVLQAEGLPHVQQYVHALAPLPAELDMDALRCVLHSQLQQCFPAALEAIQELEAITMELDQFSRVCRNVEKLLSLSTVRLEHHTSTTEASRRHKPLSDACAAEQRKQEGKLDAVDERACRRRDENQHLETVMGQGGIDGAHSGIDCDNGEPTRADLVATPCGQQADEAKKSSSPARTFPSLKALRKEARRLLENHGECECADDDELVTDCLELFFRHSQPISFLCNSIGLLGVVTAMMKLASRQCAVEDKPSRLALWLRAELEYNRDWTDSELD